jgi:hypothetical protein
MEVNTVLITIAEFDRLRKIEKKLETDIPLLYVCGTYSGKVLYTKDEALKEVADMNASLKEKLDKSDAEVVIIKKMIANERKTMSQELAIIKKMSWWQFRKWRKG